METESSCHRCVDFQCDFNLATNNVNAFVQIISFLLAHARYEDDKARIIHDIRQNAELTPFGIDEEKLKEDKTMLVKVVASIGVIFFGNISSSH
jgi:hypothetical protein